MTNATNQTLTVYFVAADGTPMGHGDVISDGSVRVYGCAVGLEPGWHFLTPADLTALGWRTVTSSPSERGWRPFGAQAV